MKSPLRLLALSLLLFGIARPARAVFVFSISQVGPDVVAVGSGTLDLTQLTLEGPNTSRSQIGANVENSMSDRLVNNRQFSMNTRIQ